MHESTVGVNGYIIREYDLTPARAAYTRASPLPPPQLAASQYARVPPTARADPASLSNSYTSSRSTSPASSSLVTHTSPIAGDEPQLHPIAKRHYRSFKLPHRAVLQRLEWCPPEGYDIATVDMSTTKSRWALLVRV